MEFKGFVGKINTKTGNGARGSWTLYSTKIQKPDGAEYPEWVTFGFDEPDVKEGDYVKIETQKDDRGNEKVVSVKKLKNPPERPAKPSAPARTGGSNRGSAGGNRFDGTGIQNRSNPADVERMSYANARDAAIKVVTLLLANGALPLSKTQTKAGEAKRFAEITAAIDKLTVQFQRDGVTLRLLDLVADARAVETKVSPLPDDADGDEKDEEEEEEEDTDEEEEEEEEE
jgi:hypothetical protein